MKCIWNRDVVANADKEIHGDVTDCCVRGNVQGLGKRGGGIRQGIGDSGSIEMREDRLHWVSGMVAYTWDIVPYGISLAMTNTQHDEQLPTVVGEHVSACQTSI